MNELANAKAALDVLECALRLVGDDQLGLPTPCRDYDVAALAGHLADSLTRLSGAAGVVVTAPAGGAITGLVDAARRAVADWRRRGTDGEVSFAGRTMAAHDLLGVIGLEFVVHGWDFATAVGDTFDVPDELADDILHLAFKTVTSQSRRNAGFDEPVPIGADARALDRLLAFTGRDPAAWIALR
ncbi:TIGR03086 family protein [Mycolicibacterium sp. P1-18]|uniref:TIGR03086 family metal-binding protein n=1 Tax=Mycolicibacterium sp. P1-18 TaxID=2024615 RepID=UPI0011F14F5D|nr:TIGR03086 family metal-binding protein [Mycolicibacterium sp. P1-18]KAA0099638.1 TIGR03086 family protein [Mycolicibacterium sp. P1-18]